MFTHTGGACWETPQSQSIFVYFVRTEAWIRLHCLFLLTMAVEPKFEAPKSSSIAVAAVATSKPCFQGVHTWINRKRPETRPLAIWLENSKEWTAAWMLLRSTNKEFATPPLIDLRHEEEEHNPSHQGMSIDDEPKPNKFDITYQRRIWLLQQHNFGRGSISPSLMEGCTLLSSSIGYKQ